MNAVMPAIEVHSPARQRPPNSGTERSERLLDLNRHPNCLLDGPGQQIPRRAPRGPPAETTGVAAGAQRQPTVLDGGGAVAVRAQSPVAGTVAGDGCQGSLPARAGEGGSGHAALAGVARVRVSGSRTSCDRCSWPRLRGRTCSGGNSVRVHPWCAPTPTGGGGGSIESNHHWHICEATPLCAPRPHVRGGDGGQALTGIRRGWLLPSSAGPT